MGNTDSITAIKSPDETISSETVHIIRMKQSETWQEACFIINKGRVSPMKFLKKLMVVLLTVIMILPLTAHAAGTDSPAKRDLANATITTKTLTYNGKTQKATLTVKIGDQTLTEGTHFTVVGDRTKKNAGTYTLKIKGIGKYTGTQTVTFTVKKAAQKVKVTGTSIKSGVKTYKASSLKKSSKTFRLKVTRKANAKVTYSAPSRKITVSKTGKVTVKKGTKKGTYKVYVKTKATKNYKASTKIIKIRVK